MDNEAKPTLETLMSNLRGWQLYVIQFRMSKTVNDVEAALAPVLHDHLLWLHRMEKRRILLFSGPFIDESGYVNFDGSGQAVIRAKSLVEAEQIAQSEPFAKAGIRTNTVVGWRVNEGHLTVRVNLIHDTFEIS